MPALTIPAPLSYAPDQHEQIQLIAVPAFSDNYIWLIAKAGHAAVVDPGQAAPIQAILQQHGLKLDAILLTHHHNDHVGGVLDLERDTGATVYGPAREQLPTCDHRMSHGDVVDLPALELSLQVMDVPGHTAGHIAYHGTLAGQPLVFCGDTLFAAGCGRLFEGTPQQMADSLGSLAALPSDTLVCCAHEYTVSNLAWALAVEPDNTALQQRMAHANALRKQNRPTLPSTMQDELETNPFLRTAQPAIAAAATRHAERPLATPTDVFAALREWKNNF